MPSRSKVSSISTIFLSLLITSTLSNPIRPQSTVLPDDHPASVSVTDIHIEGGTVPSIEHHSSHHRHQPSHDLNPDNEPTAVSTPYDGHNSNGFKLPPGRKWHPHQIRRENITEFVEWQRDNCCNCTNFLWNSKHIDLDHYWCGSKQCRPIRERDIEKARKRQWNPHFQQSDEPMRYLIYDMCDDTPYARKETAHKDSESELVEPKDLKRGTEEVDATSDTVGTDETTGSESSLDSHGASSTERSSTKRLSARRQRLKWCGHQFCMADVPPYDDEPIKSDTDSGSSSHSHHPRSLAQTFASASSSSALTPQSTASVTQHFPKPEEPRLNTHNNTVQDGAQQPSRKENSKAQGWLRHMWEKRTGPLVKLIQKHRKKMGKGCIPDLDDVFHGPNAELWDEVKELFGSRRHCVQHQTVSGTDHVEPDWDLGLEMSAPVRSLAGRGLEELERDETEAPMVKREEEIYRDTIDAPVVEREAELDRDTTEAPMVKRETEPDLDAAEQQLVKRIKIELDPSGPIQSTANNDPGTYLGGFPKRPDDKPNLNPDDYTYIKTWAAVGDSYTAGTGSGPKLKGKANILCYRGLDSYPNMMSWDERLKHTDYYQLLACGGATTQDVINNQVPHLVDGLDAMVVTAGGNDLGFARILNRCVFMLFPQKNEKCDEILDKTYTRIHSMMPQALDRLLAVLKTKLAPGGKVYYLGYAKFFDDTTSTCDSVSWSEWWTKWLTGQIPHLTQVRRARTNFLISEFNTKLQEAIARAGPQVIYVDIEKWFGKTDGRFCMPGVDEDKGNGANRPGLLFFEPKTVQDKDSLVKRGEPWSADDETKDPPGYFRPTFPLPLPILPRDKDVSAPMISNTNTTTSSPDSSDLTADNSSTHPDDEHLYALTSPAVDPPLSPTEFDLSNGTYGHTLLSDLHHTTISSFSSSPPNITTSLLNLALYDPTLFGKKNLPPDQRLTGARKSPDHYIRRSMALMGLIRSFHPKPAGHAVMANAVFWAMSQERARVLGLDSKFGDVQGRFEGGACPVGKKRGEL